MSTVLNPVGYVLGPNIMNASGSDLRSPQLSPVGASSSFLPSMTAAFLVPQYFSVDSATGNVSIASPDVHPAYTQIQISLQPDNYPQGDPVPMSSSPQGLAVPSVLEFTPQGNYPVPTLPQIRTTPVVGIAAQLNQQGNGPNPSSATFTFTPPTITVSDGRPNISGYAYQACAKLAGVDLTWAGGASGCTLQPDGSYSVPAGSLQGNNYGFGVLIPAAVMALAVAGQCRFRMYVIGETTGTPSITFSGTTPSDTGGGPLAGVYSVPYTWTAMTSSLGDLNTAEYEFVVSNNDGSPDQYNQYIGGDVGVAVYTSSGSMLAGGSIHLELYMGAAPSATFWEDYALAYEAV